MSVLNAERIKITSTRSPWWCTIAVIVVGLGIPLAIGFSSKASFNSSQGQGSGGPGPGGGPFIPTVGDVVSSGIGGFGSLIFMILAALTITSEYRFGVIRTTFQAVPNRSSVLVTKAFLIGVFAAVLSFVLAVVGVYLAQASAGPDAGKFLDMSLDGSWRAVYGTAILAFVKVVLAVGVGALLRQSAGAIALLVLWPLLVENLFNLFGSVGRSIMPFLPFLNADHFLGSTSDVGFHWGPWGSLLYFVVVTGVIFGASLFVVNRRDA